MDIKSYIRTVPDWPKKGIQFRDITTLLLNPEGFTLAMDQLRAQLDGVEFDKIAVIESRGFLLGAPMARELKKPLVLIRKPGKLPAETVRQEYSLEYGTDAIEVHRDAIAKGEKLVLMDDLCATGGTMAAAIDLCKELGADVVKCLFFVDLPDIGGSKKLREAGCEIHALCEFEGD